MMSYQVQMVSASRFNSSCTEFRCPFLLKLEVKPELSNSRVSMPSPPSSASLRNLSKTFGDQAVNLVKLHRNFGAEVCVVAFHCRFHLPRRET